MELSWQGQPSRNIWHWFCSRHNVFIFLSVLLNSNSLCRYNSTNFTKKVEIKRICWSKMHKLKWKGASCATSKAVEHMQPQPQGIWFSNWATEIALKANEANHKNQMVFRLSPKSVQVKSKNEKRQTRKNCIWDYHSNNDRCFCLDTFPTCGSSRVSNKSVSSSNPCSLSTEALVDLTTLQFTPDLYA